MKVFWSWQSDTPGEIGRHLIHDVLKGIVKELKVSAELDEPIRDVHLDHDRLGIPGSPDLARVIFEKIETAAVFVCDVTPVCILPKRPEDKASKKLINSNVALELGYALGKLTDRALLMIMNEHYGGREDLPFDLRTKAGPISYNLAPDASKETISKAKGLLKGKLTTALRFCLESRVEQIRIESPFSAAQEMDGPGRFRPPGEPLGILSSLPLRVGTDQKILLANGAAQWLRLMPINDPKRTWPAYELREVAENTVYLQPFSDYGSHSIRAADGAGMCSLATEYYLATKYSSETGSVAFAFQTGEIWSVDTLDLSFHRTIPFLEKRYAERLNKYASFLCTLGLQPPFRWICGMVDVKGRLLTFPIPQDHTPSAADPTCLVNTFSTSGQYDCKESPKSALRPFFKLLFEKCGIPRPDYLDQ